MQILSGYSLSTDCMNAVNGYEALTRPTEQTVTLVVEGALLCTRFS